MNVHTHHTYRASRAAGIDLSDDKLRLVVLTKNKHGIVPKIATEFPIPVGCITDGVITDERMLTALLHRLKAAYNLKTVRLSLPEPQVLLMTIAIKQGVIHKRAAIERALKDEAAFKPSEMIFDYQVIAHQHGALLVQVAAVQKKVADRYTSCVVKAGLRIEALELDLEASARAGIPQNEKGPAMIVDIGARKTSVAIVAHGTTVHTSTIPIGGMNIVHAIAMSRNITIDEAHTQKKSRGMKKTGKEDELFGIVEPEAAKLKDELNRRYVHWHEHRGALGDLDNIRIVYLSGGHSTLPGLIDYLSVSLKLKVVAINPWVNCFSFDEFIPSLSREAAASYVTAIGLALDGRKMTHNLLPYKLRRSQDRARFIQKALHRTVAIIGTIIIATVLAWCFIHFDLLHKIAI